MTLRVNPPPKFLKDLEVKSNDTSYLAETDGFVYANSGIKAQGVTIDIKLLTDTVDPPAIIRQRQYSLQPRSETEIELSVSGPVKKGHYWKVTGAAIVRWVPFNY